MDPTENKAAAPVDTQSANDTPGGQAAPEPATPATVVAPTIVTPTSHKMFPQEPETSTGVETAQLHPATNIIQPLSEQAEPAESAAPAVALPTPAPAAAATPSIVPDSIPPAASSAEAPAESEEQPLPAAPTVTTDVSAPTVSTASVASATPPTDQAAPAISAKTPSVIAAAIAAETQAEANAAQPTNPSGIVLSAGAEDTPPPPRFNKKKLAIIGGSIALLLALTGGVVFGWYLPNTPGAVWKTGINRSGKAIDGLVVSATEPKKLESYKTSKISGSVDATFDGGSYSGDFDTTFDATSLDGGLNFAMKSKDAAKQTLNAKVLSEIPSGSTYPNIYFQVMGFKSLGLGNYLPGIDAYDGKWIFVSSDYLKATGQDFLAGSDNNKKQITAADIAEIARVSSSVTKDYVFSTAEDKAVFEQQSFEGKEDVDGVSTYHYKVGINTDHAKAYCVALGNGVLSTAAYKKISGATDSEIASEKKNTAKDCESSVKDAVKETDTFDMWIDGKYKLVHKVRVYDEKDKTAYSELGQNYTGGDELSLFANYHGGKEKSEGKATLDVNLKTNSTKGTLSITGEDSGSPYKVTANFSASVSDKPVKITKPTNATPLSEVLDKLGLGGFVPADDTPRSSDTPYRVN